MSRLLIFVFAMNLGSAAMAESKPAARVALGDIYRKQLKTSITVKSEHGSVYHLSVQPTRSVDGAKPDAYLVFYRNGGEPTGFNLRKLKAQAFGGCRFGLDSLNVEGSLFFGCIIKPVLSFSEAEQKKSRVGVGLKEDHYQAEFSIEEIFAADAAAAQPVELAGKRIVRVGFVDDFPIESGKKSIILYPNVGTAGMVTIPVEMIIETGWLVDFGWGVNYMLRIVDGRLEFHDTRPVQVGDAGHIINTSW